MKKGYLFDEMQERSISKAGVICSLITIFYLIFEISYKYITTKDINNCSWEIVLMVIISSTFYMMINEQKEIMLPKSILGRALPIEKNKESFSMRVKHYLIESIIFSIGLAIMTFIFTNLVEEKIDFKYLIIEAILIFIISFSINFFIGENKCRKYIKWEESLEE